MIGIHITVIISVLLLIRLAFPRKFGNVPEKSLSCEVVAITYGYSRSSVLNWLRIVDSEGYDGLYIRKKRERMKKIKKKANIAEDELKELYIKLEWLEAENALLKKVKALVEAEEARKRVNGRKPSKN